MVEIRYGEHYEMADLTGRSVAEAREQYKHISRSLVYRTRLKPA
ncbi:hypothetical protein ES703_114240 [subsurface metagenome]